MIPSQVLILAVVLAFIANGFYWHAKGSNDADDRWTAKITAERLQATEKARATEKMWQEVVNGTAKNYQAKVAGIRSNLNADLDSLRDRPERAAGVPDNPRPDCTGANGPELARVNAEFLERFAAIAAEQDAGLVACYKVIDGIGH